MMREITCKNIGLLMWVCESELALRQEFYQRYEKFIRVLGHCKSYESEYGKTVILLKNAPPHGSMNPFVAFKYGVVYSGTGAVKFANEATRSFRLACYTVAAAEIMSE